MLHTSWPSSYRSGAARSGARTPERRGGAERGLDERYRDLGRRPRSSFVRVISPAATFAWGGQVSTASTLLADCLVGIRIEPAVLM
ncbi:MAG: hypothetical protein K0S98_105 [Propionibacteriaceae bacterium]|jgi:hypothetical protein|nr:hypothetical protein [Propionibacteriaceae bacterium]